MMRGGYQRGGGHSEDAGGNDSAQGPNQRSYLALYVPPSFFIKNHYFHVPKYIPKEVSFLGEQ